MSQQTKPQEFWIEKSSLGIYQATPDKNKLNGWKNSPVIHVVEMSALNKAEERIAKLEEKLTQMKDMAEIAGNHIAEIETNYDSLKVKADKLRGELKRQASRAGQDFETGWLECQLEMGKVIEEYDKETSD